MVRVFFVLFVCVLFVCVLFVCVGFVCAAGVTACLVRMCLIVSVPVYIPTCSRMSDQVEIWQ